MSGVPIVPILMGSNSDLSHARAIAAALREFGVEAQMHIASAHKTPQHVLEILAAYEAEERPKVYIVIAGRSNALSGLVDSQVAAPVIACPPLPNPYTAADLYAALRLPSHVAPAVVLDPESAALLAAKMMGLYDPVVAGRVREFQQQVAAQILADDSRLGQG